MDRRTALIAPIFGAVLLSACKEDEPDVAGNEQSASEQLAKDELQRREASEKSLGEPNFTRQSRPGTTPHVDF